MSRKRTRSFFLVASCVLAGVMTLSSGLARRPRVRTVEVLALFAGGAAFGATLVGAVRRIRQDRDGA